MRIKYYISERTSVINNRAKESNSQRRVKSWAGSVGKAKTAEEQSN